MERCELKNGKILWLCKNHKIKETQASILSNNHSNNTSAIRESNQNRMLDDLKNTNLNII